MLIRPRRNRKNATIRAMVEETKLGTENLIYPIFLQDGKGIKSEIKSLPNNYRWSIDKLLPELEQCLKLGINTYVLFPAIEERLNETLPILAKMSIAQAQAGIDILGPSDMMDGRVGYIRKALDQANFTDVSIMSYSVKYASAFYGPFRDALDSAPKAGDKKTYQMNPANRREALLEAELDIQEGYLDVIASLKENFSVPITAYNVSGECAMVYAASQNGWLNYEATMSEMLLSIRRAGADGILTYFAKDFATLLKK